MKHLFSRFFNWSHSPSESLGSAALIIAVAGVVSRLLGFIRDRLLASAFGAGDILDAYYAAFRLPDLVYGFLVLGALSAAFIPIFTEMITTEKKERAWELARGVFNLLLLALGLLALLGILFAPSLAHWLAPGFTPEKQQLVATLTRIMLLSPLFLAMSAVFGGILVSFKQFLAYSFAPIFYNVGIIIGILFLYPSLGASGLAWGVVLGSFFHMLIQYPSVREAGFRYRFTLGELWRDPAVLKVVRLMVPRSLAMAVNQISLLVVTIFASTLVSGSLAAFTLATNIQSVPLGLFGIALSLAAFPILASFAAKGDSEKLFTTLTETAHRILYFVLPLSILIIIFRAEIVRVTLGTGEFNWEDTITTFQILGLLAISLFAQSLVPLFVRVFFALQNTRTPLYAALLSEIVHIALIPILLPRLSALGLALAFSAGTIVNFILLYLFLRSRMKVWRDRSFFTPAGKMLFAAFVAGAIAQYSKYIFALAIDRLDTFIEVFLKLSLGFSIGIAAYILLSIWLKLPEFKAIEHFFLHRFRRQPETVASTEDHPEKGDW
ncbi:MAG: murein biosynthesis integral membrane protein MurJ [Candidatus Moraniibacteriota bacterium]